MARRWIKLWVQESLTGTVRFDFSSAERGVWYDLLVLAGNCRLDGVIAAGAGKPYPHSWISGTLNIPLELLESTLKKCEKSERVHENKDGIHILNWAKYQSEYDRQKPYRKAKQHHEPTKAELDATRYQGILNRKFKEFRKKNGREPTLEEENELQAAADREYDGK